MMTTKKMLLFLEAIIWRNPAEKLFLQFRQIYKKKPGKV